MDIVEIIANIVIISIKFLLIRNGIRHHKIR